MKHFLFFLFTSLICAWSNAQECEVKMETIKGTYTGECTDGKAHGKGKSVGTDQYEGEFKNGYPDGKGMYTWGDGHYFIGLYKKGYKDGKGDMYYESASGGDSVITGFWKKDKYIGLYEKQYEVISKGSIKVDCRIIDKKGEDIVITSRSVMGGAQVINNITTITGTFYTKNTQTTTSSSVMKILKVTFPFQAIFQLSDGENFEVLFNEKADYEVSVQTL